MSATAVSITSAAYVDCGVGPFTAKADRAATAATDYYVYVGPTTPGNDTLSAVYNRNDGDLSYGGTDRVFMKSAGATIPMLIIR